MKTSGIRLSTNEKITLISNLATMLAAGIPILEAVSSLLEDAKGNQKKILDTLIDDLKQGKQINFSLSKFPKTFNPVTVNLVKASEEAGTLDTTLKDLATSIREEAEFADKVKSAMTYPLFIMVVFVGVMLLMLTFVIPRISTVFSRLKVELPLPTRILIFVSNLIMTQYILIIAVTVVIVAALIILYKTKRELFTGMLFSLPLVSMLIRNIDITRFARSMYLLLNSGVPITSALELCQNVVSKKEVHDAIVYATKQVLSGKKLSESFKNKKKVFPIIMIKITEAGEKTGSLDDSMKEAAEYMDYEVSKTLKKVTTLMEPLMLVLVGVMIGGMMLAIIAPMYSIISQVGQR